MSPGGPPRIPPGTPGGPQDTPGKARGTPGGGPWYSAGRAESSTQKPLRYLESTIILAISTQNQRGEGFPQGITQQSSKGIPRGSPGGPPKESPRGSPIQGIPARGGGESPAPPQGIHPPCGDTPRRSPGVMSMGTRTGSVGRPGPGSSAL